MSAQTGAKDEGKAKKYLKGVKAEIKKVVWPTKKELMNYTAVVVAISVITALVVALLDKVVHYLLSFIIK